VKQAHQAAENADYRQCVKVITPLFLEKFFPDEYRQDVKVRVKELDELTRRIDDCRSKAYWGMSPFG
jgi:hypothetical protein